MEKRGTVKSTEGQGRKGVETATAGESSSASATFPTKEFQNYATALTGSEVPRGSLPQGSDKKTTHSRQEERVESATG